jgi:hypothetical protein
VGIHGENSLNIDLEMNNKRQDCKAGTLCGIYLWEGEGLMKSEGIWSIDIIYLYKIEQ